MRVLLTLILFLFSTTVFFGQTYSRLVSDTTIEQFIKWKLYEDTFNNANVPKQRFAFSSSIMEWKAIHLKWDSTVSDLQNSVQCIYNEGNKQLDTLLTIDDRNFIILQSQSYKSNKWLLRDNPNTKTEQGYNYYFTLPLFSLDKEYAILKELYYCGQDCGEYRIMLYKRAGTIWTVSKYLIGGVF